MVWNWVSLGIDLALVVLLLVAWRRATSPEGRGFVLTMLVLAVAAVACKLAVALL